MRRVLTLAAALALLTAGAAGAVGPRELSAAELMRHVINPAAEAFWASSGSVDSEDGSVDRAPAEETRWRAAADAAAVVQEGGTLLLTPGRLRPEPEWKLYAEQMAQAGATGFAAAKARDEAAMFDAGDAMTQACSGCHRKFAAPVQ